MALHSDNLRWLKRIPDIRFEEQESGYSKEQVDRVLAKLSPLAAEVEELQVKLTEAETQAVEVEAQTLGNGVVGKLGEAAVADHPDFDETLRNTMVIAQRAAELTLQEARDEADQLVDDATAESSEMLASAQAEAKALEDESAKTRATIQSEIDVERSRLFEITRSEMRRRIENIESELASAHGQQRNLLITDIIDLQNRSAALQFEVEKFEAHLSTRRETVLAALGELDQLVGDTGTLRPQVVPELQANADLDPENFSEIAVISDSLTELERDSNAAVANLGYIPTVTSESGPIAEILPEGPVVEGSGSTWSDVGEYGDSEFEPEFASSDSETDVPGTPIVSGGVLPAESIPPTESISDSEIISISEDTETESTSVLGNSGVESIVVDDSVAEDSTHVFNYGAQEDYQAIPQAVEPSINNEDSYSAVADTSPVNGKSYLEHQAPASEETPVVSEAPTAPDVPPIQWTGPEIVEPMAPPVPETPDHSETVAMAPDDYAVNLDLDGAPTKKDEDEFAVDPGIGLPAEDETAIYRTQKGLSEDDPMAFEVGAFSGDKTGQPPLPENWNRPATQPVNDFDAQSATPSSLGKAGEGSKQSERPLWAETIPSLDEPAAEPSEDGDPFLQELRRVTTEDPRDDDPLSRFFDNSSPENENKNNWFRKR